jgi:hypothetical protein
MDDVPVKVEGLQAEVERAHKQVARVRQDLAAAELLPAKTPATCRH